MENHVRINHTLDQIIGEKYSGIMRRKILRSDTCLLCEYEPRSVKDGLENEDWIVAMNEEIEKIEKNKTLIFVPRPKDKNFIGTKWVIKNKVNEKGEVKRNKERLVCN